MPSWSQMQKLIAQVLNENEGGAHIHESTCETNQHGCVYTDFGKFVSERYSGEHGDEYAKVSQMHEKKLEERIEELRACLSGLKDEDIKWAFSVIDPLLLVLCIMVKHAHAQHTHKHIDRGG